MGQHSLPAGLQFRNIVFWDQILFVELDHGFQLTVADGCFLILPDILAIFTLTGQIRFGEGCVSIGRNLCPEAFAVLVLPSVQRDLLHPLDSGNAHSRCPSRHDRSKGFTFSSSTT